MAHTKINTQGIPDGTIVSADLTMPITGFSSTGIDDNATSNALTIDSSGNIAVTGTVDGRDLAIDGSKLDGIAASATNYGDSNVATYISGNRTYGNITTTGYIAGPSTFTIDPAAVGDNTGTLVIAGNLQVDGTTTTINSTTMTVDDLNITLASGAANAAAANGAGITVEGASATLTYNGTNDDWNFNKTLNVTGNLNVDSNAANVTLALENSTNANGFIQYAADGTMRFYTGPAGGSTGIRTVINNLGYFGIGTSSPRSTLDLGNDTTGGTQISWHSSSTRSLGNIWTSANGGRLTFGQALKGSTTTNNGYLGAYTGTWAPTAMELSYGVINLYADTAQSLTYGGAFTPTLVAKFHHNTGLTTEKRITIDNSAAAALALDADHTAFEGRQAAFPGRFVIGPPGNNYPDIGYNFRNTTGTSQTYIAGDTAWKISVGASNEINFYDAGAGTAGNTISWRAPIMTLQGASANQVGINTGSPSARLHVTGVDDWTFLLQNSGTGGSTWYIGSTNNQYSSGGGKFVLGNTGNSSTSQFCIDSAGNIGMGTTSPAGPLHIKSATNKTLILDGTFPTGSYTWQSVRRSGTEKWRWFLENDDDITLYGDVNSVGPLMRWASSGQVFVNQASSTSGGTTSKFQVNGNIDIDGNAPGGNNVLRMFGAGTERGQLYAHATGVTLWAPSGNEIRLYSNAAETMMLESGRVGIGGDQSASGMLTINSTSTNHINLVAGDGIVNGRLLISHSSTGAFIRTAFGSSGTCDNLKFGTSLSERMQLTDGGSVYHKENGNNGSYTSYIGSASNSAAGNRYLHAQISTGVNSMFWVEVIGYDYSATSVYGRAGGYVYLYATNTSVYQDVVSGSIVQLWQNTSGYVEVVVDTGASTTVNRWGSFVFRGGHDTISTSTPIELIQYSFTSTTAKVY